MKLFKTILASVKPHFEKGGKLEKMYPAYDAFETFLFVCFQYHQQKNNPPDHFLIPYLENIDKIPLIDMIRKLGKEYRDK